MYFMGVDAGGTKTAFVLSDETGRVVARHASGTGSFLLIGAQGIKELIGEGVAALCAKAGIGREGITYAGLGFPGYGEEAGSEQLVTSACEEALGAPKVVCDCDCYLGWAGSLAMEPGINIVAGTGAICFGVNPAGESARSSGWGAYCDEGSCSWIGRRTVEAFTKQSDGRMERTALYELFRDHFSIKEDAHFIGTLNHELSLSGKETAKLQRLLLSAFEQGDPVAAWIYQGAAQELWLAIQTAARRLHMEKEGCKVSYSGGLFRAGACILEPLGGLVRQRGNDFVAPRYAPEFGAVLMAMRAFDPAIKFDEMAFSQ